jgi:uncharacterized phiE125 gp8 family phage protein
VLLKLVTAPAQEPVTLAEAKAHLRVLHDSEDTYIANLVRAARVHIEVTTGRALVTQTWDFWLAGFPKGGTIELPRPPLQSVTWVKYRDADGVEQTLAADQYDVVAPGLIGTVEEAPDATWPATQRRSQAVNVRFVAGYSSEPQDMPEDVRAAMLMLVEHLYFNRGASTAESLKATPMGVDALLGPHRTAGWGPGQVLNEIETG